MPKFTTLKSDDVILGRGRAAAIARQPYIDAVKHWRAGSVEVERGERPATVKRLLQEAAKEAGVRIRSSWQDEKQRVLVWKRVGAK